MDGDLEQLGERIAEQAAHLDAAMYRLLIDLHEFDERGGWHVQGAASCAHWLSWRVGWDLVTARERVRVARKLPGFAVIGDALRRGEVSYSKVRAMLRVATPENEVMLLEHARLMTASQLEKLSHKYALVQRHGEDPHPLGDAQRRYVRRRDTEDGMVKIEAVLHPEEAELVWSMLNHAATQLGRDVATPVGSASAEGRATDQECVGEAALAGTGKTNDSAEAGAAARERVGEPGVAATGPSSDSAEAREVRSVTDDVIGSSRGEGGDSAEEGEDPGAGAPRGTSVLKERADAARRGFDRADALVSIAQGYLRGDRPERSPVEVTLTVPASGLSAEEADPVEVAELGETFVSQEAARRMSCDAGVVEVLEDEQGTPLSVGRKRRTIAGALKRALYKRDGACTYPGCTHRMFLEGHHIQHWADGGETSLQNIALLCSLHHRHVHEYGYTIELGEDQRPRFRDPHGRLVATVPTSPVAADVGWPSIRATNEGLAIDANTIACGWDGTPVDYGAIVGHLANTDCLR